MNTVRFFNTYFPVVPLFEEVVPSMLRRQLNPRLHVSQGTYRDSGSNRAVVEAQVEYSWVPASLRRNKRAAAVFYLLLAPLTILFRSASIHVFLTQPPMLYIIGSLISRLRRIPYIIHLMDMYPEVLFVKEDRVVLDGILFHWLDRLATSAYRNADSIVVLGRCMKERLVSKGIDPERIHIVHNWSAVETGEDFDAYSDAANRFRTEKGLSNNFVVMYSGNMGYGHDIESMVRACERLSRESEVRFVFVGSGTKRPVVEEYLARSHEGHAELWDPQPIERLSGLISAADVHVVSLAPGFEGLMVPSKIYSILACGRPIIFQGSERSEVARLVSEYDCGIVISPHSDNALAGAVMQLFNNRDMLLKYSRNARVASIKLAKSVMITRYIDIVEVILNG